MLGNVFTGPAALLAVLACAFAAIYLLGTMLLGTTARAKRDKELRRRLSSRPVVEPGSEMNAVWLPGSFVRLGQRAAVATGFTDRLDAKLDMSGLPIHSGEFIALTVVGGFAGAIAGLILLHSIVVILVITAAAASVPYFLMVRGIDRRTKRFQSQLAAVLTILASSLRAGHSFMQALDTVSQEVGKPASEEFTRVVTETRLGRPVDEALNAMADRIESEDLRWTILAVNIQREVGGNLAEILDTVAGTIREREEIRGQVDVLTTEGKISAGILTALPILIAMYMFIVNPAYINLLLNTRIGLVMIATGIALLALGVLWMRKIVKIDV